MKGMIRKLLFYWLPPLALMGTIFMLSSQQNISVSEELFINFLFFKTLHMIEYAILNFLTFRALFKTTYFCIPDQLTIALLVAVAYGITDEIHQTFVPTRSGSFRDIGIDLIGIVSMYLFLRSYFPKLRKYMY
jgi:VanZ family protein